MSERYDWDKLDKEFYRKKISKAEFSRKFKIPEGTVYNHYNKHKADNVADKKATNVMAEETIELIPVNVIADGDGNAKAAYTPLAISIGQFRIDIGNNPDPDTLKTVLKIIGGLC